MFVTIVQVYQRWAIIVLNTLLCIVIFNLVLGLLYSIADHATSKATREAIVASNYFNEDGSPTDNGKRTTYQLEWIDSTAYENLSESEISQTLDEFFELSRLGFNYQPWVHFAEPYFSGQHLNVIADETGIPIRSTWNPPKDESAAILRIFVLGGSTTFGYNVGDRYTWPSFLSQVLNERLNRENPKIHVEIVNYGRAFYYPTQETALLADLLRMGHRPSLVIFMDGVNPGSIQGLPPFYEMFVA